MRAKKKIPVPTLSRLATLFGVLNELESEGMTRVSSASLEVRSGVPAAQIRKDLSQLGEMGKPGVGYDIEKLRARISALLRINRTQQFALIGAGNLGQALAAYPGFREYGFKLAAIFDNDPEKIGKSLNGVIIKDSKRIPKLFPKLGLKIAVITVPGAAAQEVVDLAIRGGARWILNFTPCHVKVPKGCMVRDVSFTQEFAVLSHYTED